MHLTLNFLLYAANILTLTTNRHLFTEIAGDFFEKIVKIDIRVAITRQNKDCKDIKNNVNT